MPTNHTLAAITCGLILFAPAASAQDAGDSLRWDIGSQKKQIVARNLQLADEQAQRFWPACERFAAELAKINDSRVGLVQPFAPHSGAITDAQAHGYIAERTALDHAVVRLQREYGTLFPAVPSGKATAVFFHLESRIDLMIDPQIASDCR